jgi:hypothetical protein
MLQNFFGEITRMLGMGRFKGPLGSGNVDLCQNWPEHQRRAVVVVSINC